MLNGVHHNFKSCSDSHEKRKCHMIELDLTLIIKILNSVHKRNGVVQNGLWKVFIKLEPEIYHDMKKDVGNCQYYATLHISKTG